MKLSVIIVSYNTKDLLNDCLSSVLKEQGTVAFKSEIIVVDNASTDDSVKLVKSKFSEVKLIINSQNSGFSAANNQGINASTGEYILLLNSDTTVKPHCFQRLTDFMDHHRQVGIVSPQLLNPDGSIQPQGGALPNLINLAAWMWFIDDLPLVNQLITPYHQQHRHFFTKNRPLGWVAGTAMLIRRSTLDKTGLLDEHIFMYSEDTDFCLRAHQQGFQVYNVSSSQVIHLGQGSSFKTTALLGEYRGLKYLYQKHHPVWQQPLLSFLLKSGALLRLLIFGTIGRDTQKYHAYQQAFKLA